MDNQFVFELKEKEEEFDLNYLCEIEDKLNEQLTEKETLYLIKWIVSRIKAFLPKKDSTYTLFCGYAADLALLLLKSLNTNNTISYSAFNINNVLKVKVPVHVITLVDFINNDNSSRRYIIDPTFRQFLVNKKYCEEKIDNISNPGYFLSLTKEGRNFGKEVLNNGFFKLTEDNLKIYIDAFIKYENVRYNRNIVYGIKEDYIEDLFLCDKYKEWKTDEGIRLTPKQLIKLKDL